MEREITMGAIGEEINGATTQKTFDIFCPEVEFYRSSKKTIKKICPRCGKRSYRKWELFGGVCGHCLFDDRTKP
jgi:hypothetical protein